MQNVFGCIKWVYLYCHLPIWLFWAPNRACHTSCAIAVQCGIIVASSECIFSAIFLGDNLSQKCSVHRIIALKSPQVIFSEAISRLYKIYEYFRLIFPFWEGMTLSSRPKKFLTSVSLLRNLKPPCAEVIRKRSQWVGRLVQDRHCRTDTAGGAGWLEVNDCPANCVSQPLSCPNHPNLPHPISLLQEPISQSRPN
jgi:hypothetical protein